MHLNNHVILRHTKYMNKKNIIREGRFLLAFYEHEINWRKAIQIRADNHVWLSECAYLSKVKKTPEHLSPFLWIIQDSQLKAFHLVIIMYLASLMSRGTRGSVRRLHQCW